jgi:hypothetical protein
MTLPGSRAALSRSGFRPTALRLTLSDDLPFSVVSYGIGSAEKILRSWGLPSLNPLRLSNPCAEIIIGSKQ